MTASSSMRRRRLGSGTAPHAICATNLTIQPFRLSCGDRIRSSRGHRRQKMPRASPTGVGGFVLGGLAIVVAGILFFGGAAAFAPKTKAVVYFDGSVGGLGPGSPVTFRGVRVGSVSRVALTIDPKIMQAR